MAEQNQALERFVAKVGHLYSLPMVAMQVLQLTSHPKVDTRALKECIENDPALAFKILRVVNSSLFGLSREVTDLNQALALLGTKPLKLLVLGFSLPDNLFVGIGGDVLRRYWQRTLTKAIAARELSERIWRHAGDEVFLAGLLQDLGMLVLMQELGKPYLQFLDGALNRGADVGALEESTLGFEHRRLSGELLRHWGLPEMFVNVVAAAQSEELQATLSENERSMAQILHVADMLSFVLCENRVDFLAHLLEVANRYRPITSQQLTALDSVLEGKVQELAELLNLDIPSQTNYPQIMADARTRLVEVASDVAGELVRVNHPSPKVEGDDVEQLAEREALAAAMDSFAIRSTTAPPVKLAPAGKGDEPRAWNGNRGERRHTRHEPVGHYHAFEIPSAGSSTALLSSQEVDPGLVGRVHSALAACRQARCAVSLLLVEIDRYDELVLSRGMVGAQRIAQVIAATCRSVDHPQRLFMQTRDTRFAVVLPACDRPPAVELANEILRKVRRFAALAGEEGSSGITISAGLATVPLPPKNFDPQDFIDTAQRCLQAAQLSGGNSLKSIGVY